MIKINTKETMEAVDAIAEEQGAEWSMRNGEITEWTKGNKPTDEEIQAKMDSQAADYIKNEYQRKRQREFASLEDQLDYIYHNGIAKWKSDMIKPVKDKYPIG